MLKRLYDWVLHWAYTPYANPAIFLLAFCESSFFPIPPDILLIALCISKPGEAFSFATICSIGSVLGGILGYIIGLLFMEAFGFKIIEFYHFTDKYNYIQQIYQQYDAWAVAIAGFTPIPYKLFTITAGAFGINFWIFVLASAISRSARFFLVSGLLYFYGERIKYFIDRYFNLLTILFTILLIGGFLILKCL